MRRPLVIVLIAVLAIMAGVGGVALIVNILERKSEARDPFYRVVELNDTLTDPAAWGKNFPLQYDGYRRSTPRRARS